MNMLALEKSFLVLVAWTIVVVLVIAGLMVVVELGYGQWLVAIPFLLCFGGIWYLMYQYYDRWGC